MLNLHFYIIGSAHKLWFAICLMLVGMTSTICPSLAKDFLLSGTPLIYQIKPAWHKYSKRKFEILLFNWQLRHENCLETFALHHIQTVNYSFSSFSFTLLSTLKTSFVLLYDNLSLIAIAIVGEILYWTPCRMSGMERTQGVIDRQSRCNIFKYFPRAKESLSDIPFLTNKDLCHF